MIPNGNLMIFASKASKVIDENVSEVQEKYGLCKIDFQILLYLDNSEGKDTASDINDLGIFTKGHISQSISRLEQRGFVDPFRDENDKRFIHLAVTPRAQPAIAEVKEALENAQKTFFKDFSATDMKQMDDYFVLITKNIEC